MSSANNVIKIALAEVGTKESPKGSNKQKYGKEYGMNGQPWCAMYIWWVFKHAGCPELFYGGKKCAYVPTIADFYIAKKQIVGKYDGKPGDIVCFDFNKNNSSDHIGLIYQNLGGGKYKTIEGNTAVGNNSNGGEVMIRTRTVSEISWIIRPKYTEKSSSTTTSSSSSKKTTSSSSKLSVDGEWGVKTTKATQKVLGTIQDGKISNQLSSCKKYLQGCSTDSWKFVSSAKSGSIAVMAIQKLVGSSRDGFCGKNTVIAMQKFLKKKGYDCGATDGYMGPKTVKAWQKYINSRL